MDLNIIKTKAVTVQDMEDIQVLNTYKLTEKAYNDYITSIQGNEDMNYNDVKKKIIRNILLSREAPVNRDYNYKRLFYYGNLSIGLNEKEKSIYYIKNDLGVNYEFSLNKAKRRMLNYIMNIKENRCYIK